MDSASAASRLVLVVDDDKTWLGRAERVLQVHGFHPIVASPQQAKLAGTTFLPDVAIAGPHLSNEAVRALVDGIRSDVSLQQLPIVVMCDRFNGRGRGTLATDRLIDRLHDPEGFEQIVEVVRHRSRISPGRQALRELRRNLVSVRERAADQQRKVVAMKSRMTHLFERMQLVRLSMMAANVPGRLLIVNDKLCALTGYARPELVDRYIWDLVAPAARPALRLDWARLTLSGASDGCYVMEKNGSPPFDADLSFAENVLPGIHVVAIDVSWPAARA